MTDRPKQIIKAIGIAILTFIIVAAIMSAFVVLEYARKIETETYIGY